jgi:FMN phosphatase YigB (HAD superfamily)
MSLYPKTLYSKTAIPKRVWTEDAEKTAREQGWNFNTYQRQDFPKVKYHKTKPPRTVNNADEEKKLGAEWFDQPQDGNLKHIDPATIADMDRTEMLERGITPDVPGAMQLLQKARKEEPLVVEEPEEEDSPRKRRKSA